MTPVSSARSGSLAVVGARRLVTPDGVVENGALFVRDGRIESVGTGDAPAADEIMDARGLTLLPGFLDLHIHGGGGADTMDATPDALRAVCRAHARHGTTGLLATTMTQSREAITRALANARAACEAGPDFCSDGAQVLGIIWKARISRRANRARSPNNGCATMTRTSLPAGSRRPGIPCGCSRWRRSSPAPGR
jgi:hypothetical protein